MTLNDHWPDALDPFSSEGLKDSRFKVVVAGYGLPIGILIIVLVNLWMGRVFMPARHFSGDLLDGLIHSYPYGWQFIGIVTGKLAIAGALFSWFALANHECTEDYALPSLLGSMIMLGLGFVVYAVGFFV